MTAGDRRRLLDEDDEGPGISFYELTGDDRRECQRLVDEGYLTPTSTMPMSSDDLAELDDLDDDEPFDEPGGRGGRGRAGLVGIVLVGGAVLAAGAGHAYGAASVMGLVGVIVMLFGRRCGG